MSNCGHYEDVVITCSSTRNLTLHGNIRLANPQNITDSSGSWIGVWGRAEIYNLNNNTWN